MRRKGQRSKKFRAPGGIARGTKNARDAVLARLKRTKIMMAIAARV